MFKFGVRPPLPREEYDHVHIGDKCVLNRWPECGTTETCTACQLARMLEGGRVVLEGQIDAGHSSCEGTRSNPCGCGCDYSKSLACKECGRKRTALDDGGQCVDRRDCSNAILAVFEASRQERAARAASAPPKRSGGRSSASPRPCRCECGEQTGGGNYRPGHDARHVSQLANQVRVGSITSDRALEKLSHSEALQAKLRKAVDA